MLLNAAHIAVLLLALSGQSAVGHRWMKDCWPTEDDESRCFQHMPNNGAHAKSFWNWIVPRPGDDSYVVNDQETFDTLEFSVNKIEQDPKYICQQREQFIAAMECSQKAVVAKCPFMKEKMKWSKKYMKVFNRICDKMPELNSVCLHNHWTAMKVCRHHVHPGKMGWKSDSSHGKGGKGGGGYGGKGGGGYGGKGGGGRGKGGGGRGKGGGRYGGRNSTMRGDKVYGGKNMTWGGRNRTRGGGGWWNRNRTKDEEKDFQNMMCKYRYRMYDCTRMVVQDCDFATADVMNGIMREMVSEECQAQMVTWDKQKSDEVGAAPPGNSPLSPLLLAAVVAVVWMA